MISDMIRSVESPEGSNPFLTCQSTGRDSDKTPTSERFWSKVAKGEPDECWIWRRAIDREGYGRFTFDRKRKFAHRIAYLLTHGRIPDGQSVLHKCDNPLCVNPRHLFLGTHRVNMDDRGAKGRTASGERNGRAKLKAETVRQILAAYVPNKVTLPMLAERFGVNKYVVQDILRGRTWKAEVAAWRALGATEASIADRSKFSPSPLVPSREEENKQDLGDKRGVL